MTNPSSSTLATLRAVPITDIATLRDAGIHYPKTVDGWRWAYRRRHENGLQGAFKKIGARVCVDVPAYLEALSELPAA